MVTLQNVRKCQKRKVDAEGLGFKKIWTTKYLFTEVGGTPVCLVCGEQVGLFKEYNVSRHYETKHAEKYRHLTETERVRISKDLLAKTMLLEALPGLWPLPLITFNVWETHISTFENGLTSVWWKVKGIQSVTPLPEFSLWRGL